MHSNLYGLTVLLAAALAAGPVSSQSPAASAAEVPAAHRSTVPASLPLVVVHKSPTCGCCTLWVDHLRAAGFPVDVRESDDLEPLKRSLGVPFGKGSCHTAEVAGYYVEGHVPAADIQRLLADRPDARGLVLPGMPLGSPGMETADGTVQRYTVELVGRDGTVSPYARH